MKFVEKHLTRHHLFHAPHKWFFALISSPIHFAELHYKKQYHLTYVHARKLFIFDMTLLVFIVALLAMSLFWFMYDPTITNEIDLFVHSNKEKITSGEYVSYTFSYKNTSDVELIHPKLHIIHPIGFIIDSTKPSERYDSMSETFTLQNIHPGAEGTASVSGYFYSEPKKENIIRARLSYTQKDRATTEQKQVAILTTLHGSVITSNSNIPKQIIAASTIPFTTKITTPVQPGMEEIRVPLSSGYITLESYEKPTMGFIEQNQWIIPIDKTVNYISAQITGKLKTNIPKGMETSVFELTPLLRVNGQYIPQSTETHTLSVVHPDISMSSEWKKKPSSIQPGRTTKLILTIHNTGMIPLSDLELLLNIPTTIINTTKLVQKNIGSFESNTFKITQKHNAALQNIEPGQTKHIELSIPIRELIYTGEDITLTLIPKIEAHVNNIDAIFSTEAPAPLINIGTHVDITGSLRYYTDEGDQLGRGPLPPTPGKQTTYWAFIKIKNTTSDLENVQLIAPLSQKAEWGEKSSVSHGGPVTYNAKKHTATWNISVLPAHTTVGVYMALNFTPESVDVGKTPALLEKITVTGYDTHTKEAVSATQNSGLDISLSEDTKATSKGVIVQ